MITLTEERRQRKRKKKRKKKKKGGWVGGGVCSSKNSPHLSLAFLSLSLVVYSCLRTTESGGGGGGGTGEVCDSVVETSGRFLGISIPGYELGGDRTGQNLTRHSETVFDF